MHLFVATRGEIFSLKFTKYRLAAGLCPDPLGELKRSPGPPSCNKGGLLLRGGERRGGEGRGGGMGGGNLLQAVRGDRRPCWPGCHGLGYEALAMMVLALFNIIAN